jgi:hypothetical protein
VPSVEFPLSAPRAVEEHLCGLIEIVAAEVRAPALLVRRKPQGPAFNTPRDQRNAFERHAASLGRGPWTSYCLLVPLLKKKTPEEIAAKAAADEQRKRESAERKRLAQIEKAKKAFFATPAGKARRSFESGDHVFQYSLDVMNQEAIIVAMMGSTTSKKEADPSAVLNSVCAEGWELVTGSFVFVEQGHQSRDKFMSSGQNIAIKGRTVGYYLFKRCEENRRESLSEPWLNEEAMDPSANADDGFLALRALVARFNDGDTEEVATALRELREDAIARHADELLDAISEATADMRSYLQGPDLASFDKSLG